MINYMNERNLTIRREKFVMVHMTKDEHSQLEKLQIKLSCSKSQVLRLAFLHYIKNGSDIHGATGQ